MSSCSSIISNRNIKRTIQKYWNGDVTEETINEINQECESIVNERIKSKVQDFKAFNEKRCFHGLPKLKRFDLAIFKKFLLKHKIPVTSFVVGELGEVNKNTSFSEAEEMDGFQYA